MSRRPASRARRTLLWTTALVAALVVGLAAAVQFSTAAWTPKLALDLAGGTEIILTPQVRPGQGTITDQTITDAIAIIRDRVDSSGSTEAEVSSQGGRNIVVDLPGDIASQRGAVELVSQSAQMRFRPVLTEASTAPAASASPSASGTDPAATPSSSSSASATAAPSGTTVEPSATPRATSSTAGDRVPEALLAPAAATPSGSASATPSAAATPDAASSAAASVPAEASAAPSASPTDPSDLSQVTQAMVEQFTALDCSDPAKVGTQLDDAVDAPIVTCSTDGSAKYILGPVEVKGTDISGASAGLVTTSTGAATNQWAVNLTLDGVGRKAFAATSTRLFGLTAPQNQFAIELDGTVVSAPRIDGPITDGNAQITGSFTQDSATTLANQLKFGALPISFEVQSTEQISALLGSEQLQRGLLAGFLGLVLVVLYSLAQYRALGLVTVGSLVIAGVINFLAIDLLSWYQGYRLSLAGVAGFIVSIGITADSFIVYFERVRDEVREGRSLAAAVANGWVRARRTILISDAVNFLAAAVLYVLASGNVRGFAFTLGLTTIIDLLVVVGFTHPMLVVLSGRRFFATGHRLSGFDAEHLGRAVAYAGRGRVRTPAERVPAGVGAFGPRGRSRGPDGLEEAAGFDGTDGTGGFADGRPRTIAERRAAQRQAEEQHQAAADEHEATPVTSSTRPSTTQER